MNALLQRLTQPAMLIADGATGTQLQRAGLPAGAAPERWNLEYPDAILRLHRSYLDAGADVILTNTFGGTRIRLERDGLADKVVQINKAAAALAREAAGGSSLVFGDIGPTGALLEPYGALPYADAVAAFAEQAAALASGGVDAILIETMSDLNEAKAAVEGARQVTDLPVLVTLSFDTRGRSMMGVRPAAAAKELWALGVNVIGANCGRTLSETLTAIQEMRQAVPEAVLMAKPNAGLPHLENEQSVYDVTPEVMAEWRAMFAEQGVRIFGGCCGSTPAHIRAIATAARGA
jgi:5-methyltetrahydrofolate--homocysteine methyltransferase